MGKAQQQKGRRAEIDLSRLLNSYGYSTRPGEPLSFGREADIVGLDGIHLELKRRENPDISAALRQAREDSERFGDGLPAVFTRGNRQRWRVVMDLDMWLQMYRDFAEKHSEKGVNNNEQKY